MTHTTLLTGDRSVNRFVSEGKWRGFSW